MVLLTLCVWIYIYIYVCIYILKGFCAIPGMLDKAVRTGHKWLVGLALLTLEVTEVYTIMPFMETLVFSRTSGLSYDIL